MGRAPQHPLTSTRAGYNIGTGLTAHTFRAPKLPILVSCRTLALALFALVAPAAPAADPTAKAKGTVINVLPNPGYVSVVSHGRPHMIWHCTTADKTRTITKKGKPAAIADVKPYDEVEMTYTLRTERVVNLDVLAHDDARSARGAELLKLLRDLEMTAYLEFAAKEKVSAGAMAAFHVFSRNSSEAARKKAEKVLIDSLLDAPITETMLMRTGEVALSTESLEKIAGSKARAPVRAVAAVQLANRAYSEAWFDPTSKDRHAKAIKLFEALKKDYGDEHVGETGVGRQCDWNLFRLNKLWVGEPALELKGETADGKTVSLADYRGKVVFLSFHYSQSLGTDIYFSERQFLKDYADKPFACISVCLDCSKTALKQHKALNRVSWPNIADGGKLPPDTLRAHFPSPLDPGPNEKAWQIHPPSVFVIDKKGVIRHNISAGNAKTTLDALLK